MNAALIIASRELMAMLRTPVAYVVGVAFLVVQGLSFAWLVEVLSDPARPAPLGAVLEGHFGGTLLHWALQILVVSALAMRTIAEDRRAGTWEVLLRCGDPSRTAPIGLARHLIGPQTWRSRRRLTFQILKSWKRWRTPSGKGSRP